MSIRRKFRPFVVQGRALRQYAKRAFNPYLQAPVGREPAFDPETKAWFTDHLARARSYLEYGAGASTLLAAEAGVPAISIESDARYAEAVRAAMPPGPGNMVVSIDIGATEEWGYPLWTFPTKRALRRWRKYPSAGPALWDSLPGFPDLVLIDGRFRVASCLAMAKASVENGATTNILFDDYALRPHYHCVETILGTPEAIGRAASFRIDPAMADPKELEAAMSAAMHDYR